MSEAEAVVEKQPGPGKKMPKGGPLPPHLDVIYRKWKDRKCKRQLSYLRDTYIRADRLDKETAWQKADEFLEREWAKGLRSKDIVVPPPPRVFETDLRRERHQRRETTKRNKIAKTYRDLVKAAEGKKATKQQIIDWVAANIFEPLDEIDPNSVPDPGAPQALEVAKANRKEFVLLFLKPGTKGQHEAGGDTDVGSDSGITDALSEFKLGLAGAGGSDESGA